MDKKRREFLKIAGISTLAGLGAPAVVDRIVTGTSPLVATASTEADSGGHGNAADSHAAPAAHGEEHGAEIITTGKRYGMVIDVKKFYNNPAFIVCNYSDTIGSACTDKKGITRNCSIAISLNF